MCTATCPERFPVLVSGTPGSGMSGGEDGRSGVGAGLFWDVPPPLLVILNIPTFAAKPSFPSYCLRLRMKTLLWGEMEPFISDLH